jgi:hypothetical protein
MSFSKELEHLLRDCTVRVRNSNSTGTGFFVAPGYILTCLHVIEPENEQIDIFWHPNQTTYVAEVIERRSDPIDLVLLKISLTGHPCVYLDIKDPLPVQDLHAFGYPQDPIRSNQYSGGESIILSLRGSAYPEDTRNISRLRFLGDMVRYGFSGAPLLSQKSDKVCGMIQRHRLDSRMPEGKAIPISEILKQIEKLNLARLNSEFHKQDNRWNSATRLQDEDLVPPGSGRFLNYITVLLFLFSTVIFWLCLGLRSTHQFPYESAGELIKSCFAGLLFNKDKALEKNVVKLVACKIYSSNPVNSPEQEINVLNRDISEGWLLGKVVKFLAAKSRDESVPKISSVLSKLNHNHAELEEKLVSQLRDERWQGRYAGLKLFYFAKPFFQNHLAQDYARIVKIIGTASSLSENEGNSALDILSQLSRDIRENVRKIDPERLAILYKVEDLARNISLRNASVAESQLSKKNEQIEKLKRQVDGFTNVASEILEILEILGPVGPTRSEWSAKFREKSIKITCSDGVSARLRPGIFEVRLQIDHEYSPNTTYTVVEVIKLL